FSWQGSIAPGKGNAGGSVHLELPKGSGLAAALICLSLALALVWMPLTAWFGAGVLVVFAGYHARRWWRARAAARLATPTSTRGLVAGVCSRLAERFSTSPWLFRVAFLASACVAGTGFLAYGALWFVLPRRVG